MNFDQATRLALIESEQPDESPGNNRSMHPLVGRFQRCRWSKTRSRIDALEVGESVTITEKEFNNATTSIQRLQEAYEHTRRWRMKEVAAGWRVERVAPNGGSEQRRESNRDQPT